MTALAADRPTPRRAGRDFEFPHKTGIVFFHGALAVLDSSGDCEPGRTATGLVAVGVCRTATADPGRPDGRVRIERGVFPFANSASADAITAADWGKTVYIVDDQTVAKTNGTNTRSAAGICRGVDADGVWVEI